MELISDILYWISTGLLVPVIVSLFLLFIRSLILVGTFFGQYITLRKSTKQVRDALTGLNHENIVAATERLPKKSGTMVVAYAKKMIEARNSIPEVERLLAEYEIEADKDLGLSKMLSKLGPMLGLMGTLIPMGPALAGLASGDIDSMARNMQVAFATTVTGLVAAAIGFISQQVKQRWYQQDLANLEYLAQIIKGE